MRRIMTSTALVFAGVLLLAGSSAGGGTATPSADPCETLSNAVRDISNGVQNALAAADPAELQATLEGYTERVDELDQLVEGGFWRVQGVGLGRRGEEEGAGGEEEGRLMTTARDIR